MTTTNKQNGKRRPHLTFVQDPSRYGMSVYEDGYRVLGTWAMSREMAMKRWQELGDKRVLDRSAGR